MIRRILHPTDFSPASRAAFAHALEMARANRAELVLLHVLSAVVPVPGDGYISPKVYEQIAESNRAWAQKQLDRLVARAKAARVRVRGMLADGVAHDQIVRVARARRADLLVLGTHGRTGLAKVFLGSVASRVVAAAPCPVLTVRGKK